MLQAAAAGAAALAFSQNSPAEQTSSNPDFTAIQKEIDKRHDESVQRLQKWISQPSIAAKKRGIDEGRDLTMLMLRDAGFGEVTKIPTDGQPAFLPRSTPVRRAASACISATVKQAEGRQ